MLLNATIDHGQLPYTNDHTKHWFFANSDGLHLFVSNSEGNNGDNKTNHFFHDGSGWVLHEQIDNIVIEDVTQLDDQTFGILGHNIISDGMGLLISRNTDPINGSGIANYKVASDIHIDDRFEHGVNISSTEISPGEYKVTYSQIRDKSSVHMKHLTIKQSSSDPDKYDILSETDVTKVHEDATDVTAQVNHTLENGSGVIAYSTFIEYDKREQIFAKVYDADGALITSEFKVSDGDNRTDTITGIVSIEHDGSEVIGFLHYAGNYQAGMAGSLSLTVANLDGSIIKSFDLFEPSETPNQDVAYHNPVIEKLDDGNYLLTWTQGVYEGDAGGQYAQTLEYSGDVTDPSSFLPTSEPLKITNDTHGSFNRGQETKGMFAQGEEDQYLSYWDISHATGNVMQYTFEGISLDGKGDLYDDHDDDFSDELDDGWQDHLEADASGLEGGVPINVGGKDFNFGVGLWDGSDISVRIDDGSVNLYRIGYNNDRLIYVDSGLLGQSYSDLSQAKIWMFGNKGILGVTSVDNFYWRTIELQTEAEGGIPNNETGVTYGEIYTIPHSLSEAGFSLENVKLSVLKLDDADVEYSGAKFILENEVSNQEIDILSVLSGHAPDFFVTNMPDEHEDDFDNPVNSSEYQERTLLGSGDDLFFGSSESDYVKSGGGNDKISTGAGDDKIYVQGSSDVKTETLIVTVSSTNEGNKYFINGQQQAQLNLKEGTTYIFDQSDPSNYGHQIAFSSTEDGYHGQSFNSMLGGMPYGNAGEPGGYTELFVTAEDPNIFYFCEAHPGMGSDAQISPAQTEVVEVDTGAGDDRVVVEEDWSGTLFVKNGAGSNSLYIDQYIKGSGAWDDGSGKFEFTLVDGSKIVVENQFVKNENGINEISANGFQYTIFKGWDGFAEQFNDYMWGGLTGTSGADLLELPVQQEDNVINFLSGRGGNDELIIGGGLNQIWGVQAMMFSKSLASSK